MCVCVEGKRGEERRGGHHFFHASLSPLLLCPRPVPEPDVQNVPKEDEAARGINEVARG